jgi:chromosome segregation ATPase
VRRALPWVEELVLLEAEPVSDQDNGPRDDDKGLRGRVTKGSEEAIGKLAQELLENPMVTGALSAMFETRERATRAQEVAMGALNLPSASDLERLTRRLRGVSQRLEGLEDGLDTLQDKIDELGTIGALEARLEAIEASLARIEAALADTGAAAADS